MWFPTNWLSVREADSHSGPGDSGRCGLVFGDVEFDQAPIVWHLEGLGEVNGFCHGVRRIRLSGATGELLPPPPPFDPGYREKQHPINGVWWDEAKAHCEWAGGRLPSEAEREYADIMRLRLCRAKSTCWAGRSPAAIAAR